jgi:environmental stress-induced protein Ves
VLNLSLDYANFKGEDLIDATLHNGPIKDFNIMTLRSICTSSVTAIDETSESLLNINADKLLVYSIKPVNIQIGLEASISLEANHLLQFNYYINNTMILDKTQAIVIQINYKK